jgi:hypothetical protein
MFANGKMTPVSEMGGGGIKENGGGGKFKYLNIL